MTQPPIPPTYSIQEAEEKGYQSITIPYSIKNEIDQQHLTNVLLDLVGLDHCLIETGHGLEVGRQATELL
jgi:hypothetical protein